MSRQPIVEVGLITAVVVAVAFFGGTEPISFAVVEALLLGLGCMLLLAERREGGRARLPALIPAILLGIALFELIPLPRGFLKALLDRNSSLAATSFAPVSQAPYATQTQLLHWVTYLTAFYLVLVIARRQGRLRRLVLALIFVAGVESIWGIAQFLTGWQPLAGYVPGAKPLGTYVNRDHFAGLLEMIFPFALAMAFCQGESALRLGEGSGRRSFRSFLLGRELGPFVFWFFLSAVLFLGIVSSLSRMGIISALLATGLVSFLAVSTLRRRRLGSLLAIGFVCLAACLALWVGLQPVIARYMDPNPFRGRLEMWRDTLAMIRRSPVLGSGLGALAVAITSVQTTDLDLVIDHAHNDYLEFAAELGLPAAVVLFGSFFWLFWHNLQALYRQRGNFARLIALGSAGALAAIFTHSVVDFNLHIPANALVFSLVLAMAYQVSRASSGYGRLPDFAPN